MVMDLFHIQLTALLCLLLGNILFGSFPVLLGKCIEHFSNGIEAGNRKTKWCTFFQYIGAGIFISDSFLVLLPLANQEFTHSKNYSEKKGNTLTNHSEADTAHHHDSFPIPEFLVLCGFFLAYILQEMALYLYSKFTRIPKETRDSRVRFCSCAKRHTECSRAFKDARPDQTLFGMEKKLMESGSVPATTAVAANVLPEVDANSQSELLRSSILAQAVTNYGTVTNVTEPAIDNQLPVLTTPVLLAEEIQHVISQQAEKRNRNKFLTSSVLIVITLTLQYIFLGICLGLRTDKIQQWRYLLVACLQNFMLTFSAGSHFSTGNVELSCVMLLIGLLSTVSPIGMIAAMVEVTVVQQIPHLAVGIVSAIACGSLLYTTFYEMIRHKNFTEVFGMAKFLAIIIGSSIMILLQYGTLSL